jgi:tetratricopeptide (TPR) repeat protein
LTAIQKTARAAGRPTRGANFHAPGFTHADRGSGEWPPSDARIRLYERALRRDPLNHLLLIDLAGEYGRHRRLVDADGMLQRVIELYPQSARVRAQVAASYTKIGLPRQAIEQYRQSLELDPLQPSAAVIMNELAKLDAT